MKSNRHFFYYFKITGVWCVSMKLGKIYRRRKWWLAYDPDRGDQNTTASTLVRRRWQDTQQDAKANQDPIRSSFWQTHCLAKGKHVICVVCWVEGNAICGWPLKGRFLENVFVLRFLFAHFFLLFVFTKSPENWFIHPSISSHFIPVYHCLFALCNLGESINAICWSIFTVCLLISFLLIRFKFSLFLRLFKRYPNGRLQYLAVYLCTCRELYWPKTGQTGYD